MLSQLVRYILKIPYKKFIFKENLIFRPYLTMVNIPDENEFDYLLERYLGQQHSFQFELKYYNYL